MVGEKKNIAYSGGVVNVKKYPLYFFSYSMEIKEQTRKQASGCSKHCFEVADGS